MLSLKLRMQRNEDLIVAQPVLANDSLNLIPLLTSSACNVLEVLCD